MQVLNAIILLFVMLCSVAQKFLKSFVVCFIKVTLALSGLGDLDFDDLEFAKRP